MTPDQIDRLAAAGNALRPDWPVNSLRTFITTNLHWRGYGDLAVALTYIATKTDTETPKPLLASNGACWKAALIDDPNAGNRRPPRKDEECATHPGEYAPPICRCCAADKRARRDETTEAEREHARMTARQAIAEARAQVRAGRETRETTDAEETTA